MASTKPYIGYNSLFWDHRDFLRASSEDASHEVELLANYQPGTYWTPSASDWLAGDVYLYVYPVAGQLLDQNWYFRDWDAGLTAAPTGWTLDEGTVAATADPVVGVYSAGLTRAGTDALLTQSFVASDYIGRQFAAGVWVRSSEVDQARIAITDGTTTWSSAYHTGGGDYEWLSVATAGVVGNLTIRLEVNDTDGTAYFDGVLLNVGATAAQTPHATAADYLAIHEHNLSTAGVTISVEHSDDQASWTSAGSLAPTTDKTQWLGWTSATKKFWRVKFAATGTYSQRPRVAVLSLGAKLTLPQYCGTQSDHLHRKIQTDMARNAYGAPLGRSVRMEGKRFVIRQQWITRTSVTSTLEEFRAHAYGEGLPFFVAPDYGSYPAEVYFAWVPDDAEWSPVVVPGQLIRELALRMEAMPE